MQNPIERDSGVQQLEQEFLTMRMLLPFVEIVSRVILMQSKHYGYFFSKAPDEKVHKNQGLLPQLEM
jgi:hypothetical protein